MQGIDGKDALSAMRLYPEWAEDTVYTVGFKVRHGGKLWRCLADHTSIATWEPENAPSLWETISESHTGAREDPIPYDGNMVLTSGLYYMQEGAVYLCTRDTGNPVYHALADLVGQYVEVVQA